MSATDSQVITDSQVDNNPAGESKVKGAEDINDSQVENQPGDSKDKNSENIDRPIRPSKRKLIDTQVEDSQPDDSNAKGSKKIHSPICTSKIPLEHLMTWTPASDCKYNPNDSQYDSDDTLRLGSPLKRAQLSADETGDDVGQPAAGQTLPSTPPGSEAHALGCNITLRVDVKSHYVELCSSSPLQALPLTVIENRMKGIEERIETLATRLLAIEDRQTLSENGSMNRNRLLSTLIAHMHRLERDLSGLRR